MDEIFKNLNQSQEQAIKHIQGPLLILAGAGSGKTKTITSRLAYLIDQVGIAAENTLTLTFTNKAANVMRQRALSMIKSNTFSNPLLCTFHKFGLLFLRLHIERLNRKNNFIIIDIDDKKNILKDIIENKELNINLINNYISNLKNNCVSVEDALLNLNFINQEKRKKEEEIIKIYKKYQNYLLQNNFVDFDDLLLLSNEILEQDENFAKEQSNNYNYIMVDEYQDTNDLQYKLLKNLCKSHDNICVVGDDDQSIYSWRGANINNILNFQKEFENTTLIKLEQNYRSTNQILNAANILIKHNKNRLGKTLICTKEEGEKIKIKEFFDEKEESFYISSKIKKLINQSINPNQIAILYRVNALSRAIEEGLMKEKIPFKILSGIKFYERAEVKDIIAYLRLITNEDDELSFKRIINKPKRNFGKTSLQKLQEYANLNNLSLFKALCDLSNSNFFSTKTNKEIKNFIKNIQDLQKIKNPKEIINSIEQRFKIKEFYQEDEKIQNIDELYASLKDKIDEDENLNIENLLNEISLLSDQDNISENSVCAMSVHASKGLEFDYVFIVGLEEGFFPINSDTCDIEEERRLAYVAITRAKKELNLSYVNYRFYKGVKSKLEKSTFLTQITNSKNVTIDNDFKNGDLVQHKIFGIGRVISVQKDKLSINFGGIERKIMSNFVEKLKNE